jgi:Flagellar P-ring protein/HEAT repeats
VRGIRKAFGETREPPAPFKDERMNPWSAARLSRRHLLACAAAGALGAAGCKTGDTPLPVQKRAQIGDDPREGEIVTVGAKTTVGNTEPILASGVALVSQLAGTGSSPPQGGWRSKLEEDFKKLRRDQQINVKALLDNPERSTSLVLVTVLIPPGARKGEKVDVQVTLPEESKTTSLQGGVLFPCDLFESENTGNIRAAVRGTAPTNPGVLLLGKVWAKAAGPLVAGNFETDAPKRAADVDQQGRIASKAGFIAGGATVTDNRPYYLILNPNDQNVRIASGIAERLNATFHGTGDPNRKVAEAKSKDLVLLNVPYTYRHNHYRFLLSARHVPYSSVGADFRTKLEDELMDPTTALVAAVKLEALGGDCRKSLRLGLESPSPWVRFAASEALAYLGQTDGATELAQLAKDYPALRAHCLKALASIDDSVATDRLVDMLSSPDAELRQGAFIALRLADERHPALNGTLMNRSYWLHRVAPDAPPAVHLSTAGRSEIVVFGNGATLRDVGTPMAVGGDFTVTVPEGEVLAKVTRIVKGRDGAEVKDVRCAANVAGVLGAMAALGGGYAEAIEFVRRAARSELIEGKLVVDSIPREMSLHQLVGFAKIDTTLARANAEVAKVGTVNPDVAANGFELPSTSAEPVTPAGAQLVRPPLSRDPGRLFGPKRAADTPAVIAPAVVPAAK